MSATIEVVCYKSKVLANNESPLMLRITKDRNRKYSSIGVSVNPALWDFEKNKPRRNCPNRLQIERLIADKIDAYRAKMIELQAEKKEFTATSLYERVADKTSKRTIGEVFQSQIANLKQTGRTGYALSHQEVYNSLLKFNGHYYGYVGSNDSVDKVCDRFFRKLLSAGYLVASLSVLPIVCGLRSRRSRRNGMFDVGCRTTNSRESSLM